MDRRTRNAFAVILVVVIALAGGAALLPGGGTAPPTPPSDAASVTGVVVAVDARSLTDVRSFDVRIPGGGVRRFGLATLKNGVAFPPGHLSEHMTTASPVRVYYRVVDGAEQAVYLEDAPAP